MSSNLAPIAVFCFRRLDLIKKLIRSIKRNSLSKDSPIFFFIDSPKHKYQKKEVNKIIQFLKEISYFKKKKIIIRNKNYGVKNNILKGVSHIFNKFDKVIVLEDDLEISKNFLYAMNKLLKIHRENKDIFTITGYAPSNIELNLKLRNDFFLCKRPSSWGWATWKGKWYVLKKNKSKNKFYSDYGNDLILMKKKSSLNQLNSWAFSWTLNHIEKGKYCLYPKISLVKNNGFDKNSTNNVFRRKKFYNKLKFFKIKNFKSYQKENDEIISNFKSFYNENKILYILKYIFYEAKKKFDIF